jgi:arylsulfatase
MAGNAPWRLYKIDVHAGGHTVPFVLSWPARLAASGELRDQYTHVTDVLPTILDVIGIEAPSTRDGVALKAAAGATFAPTLLDPGSPSAHGEQHYESWGSRGFYRGGWEAVTLHQPMTPFSDAEWELYDLNADRNELHDLARTHPDKLRELAEAWEAAAWANQVYPLDEGSSVRYLVRPPWSAVYGEHAVTIAPGTPTLERWRSVQLVWFRAVRIVVSLDAADDDAGILFAHGDQGSGYACYVLDGELRFVHNDGRGRMRELSGGEVPAGATEIVCDMAAPGKHVWDVSLSIDGAHRATLDGVPMLYGMAPFEGIDVGIDRRSPVSWDLYERFGPFPYTGALRWVRYEPGEPAPDSPNRMVGLLRELGSRYE